MERADLHVLDGTIRLAKREFAPARQAFQRALTIAPNELQALEGLLTTEIESGNLPGARAEIEQRVAQRPSSLPLLLLAARTAGSAAGALGDRHARAMDALLFARPPSAVSLPAGVVVRLRADAGVRRLLFGAVPEAGAGMGNLTDVPGHRGK